MKLCKDCKWAKLEGTNRLFRWKEFMKCHHPSLIEKNAVDGKERTYYCGTMRIHTCGSEGKLWEAKK